MNKCKDCKYRQIETCIRLNGVIMYSYDSIGLIENTYNPIDKFDIKQIKTNEDFGCILWEKKDEQMQDV